MNPETGTGDAVKPRLAYILAASHSGSTLLAMVLGSHPEIATAGELKLASLGDPARYRCSCREFIGKCPFWTGIAQDMARMGFAFDMVRPRTDFRGVPSPYVHFLLRPLLRGRVLETVRDAALALSPAWRLSYPEIQSRNAALVACIAQRTRRKIVVDSSKIAVRLKYLLRNPEIDIRVIRLVRDGRAVSLTYMDESSYADASDSDLRGGGLGIVGARRSRTMEEAAREWRRSNEEAEILFRGMDPSRGIEVRYEAFCGDPRKETSRILSFLGVSSDDAVDRFRTAEFHVVGNGMRLDERKEVRLDERWKSVLSRRDLEIFESVAGRLNREMGYA